MGDVAVENENVKTSSVKPERVLTDTRAAVVNLFQDTVYILQGQFERRASEELNIEEGTLIKAIADVKTPAALRAMREGNIDFNPTYKYEPTSTTVYDDGKKKRVPSWCDRILFRDSKRIEVIDYNRVEIIGSDHAPIHGCFGIDV